jgi:hypothetical protein
MLQQLLITLVLLLSLAGPLSAANSQSGPQSGPHSGQLHALLIGVSDYQHPGAKDLLGPRHDVAVLQDYLQQQAPQANLISLVDDQATKSNILQSLEQLGQQVQPQDRVLIYFSGHGTSRYDSGLGLPIAHGSGALMPHDVLVKGEQAEVIDSLIIGNRDLQPRLKALDAKGAQTLVIFDACYAGNSVRSLLRPNASPSKSQPVFLSNKSLFSGGIDDSLMRDEAPPYPYQNIAFLSASSDSEVANDIPDTSRTYDGNPHGAFTDALMRVLLGQEPADSNGDQRLSTSEIRLATNRVLERQGFGHTPQTLPAAEEDAQQLRNLSHFPAPSASNPNVTNPGSSAAYRLRVQLGAGAEDLRRLLAEQSQLQLTDSAPSDLIIQLQDQHWQLHSAAGDPIGRIPQADTQRLLQRLRQQHWIERLALRQQQHNPFQLELDVVPSTRGNTFRTGEFLTFRINLAQPAWLVLLDIDSQGNIIPLYPYQRAEAEQRPAQQALYLPHREPSQAICATLPEGTDHLIALAFAQKPDQLHRLIGQEQLASDDPALLSWQAQLENPNAPIAVSVTKLRIVPGDRPCP